jgi:hypothetical protein
LGAGLSTQPSHQRRGARLDIGDLRLVLARKFPVDRLAQLDALLEPPEPLDAVTAVDQRARPWLEAAAIELRQIARLCRLRRLAVCGIEIAQQVLDRGNVGLRRLLVHRLPGWIDRVVEVGLAIVLANERLDLICSARGEGYGRIVRHDCNQQPRPAWSQLLQEFCCNVSAVGHGLNLSRQRGLKCLHRTANRSNQPRPGGIREVQRAGEPHFAGGGIVEDHKHAHAPFDRVEVQNYWPDFIEYAVGNFITVAAGITAKPEAGLLRVGIEGGEEIRRHAFVVRGYRCPRIWTGWAGWTDRRASRTGQVGQANRAGGASRTGQVGQANRTYSGRAGGASQSACGHHW